MPKRYYITTPIYYVNSVPHIGTALTTVASDMTARYQRMRGQDVYFVTGTDENAIKVAEAAQAAGKETQQFVDEVSAEFRRIWGGLNVQFDDFIRTTEERHVRTVQEVFSRLKDAGHIYLDKYEGWYDVSAETFLKESDLIDGKSPEGNEVRWVQEENYFFRLSAFQDRLIQHIEANLEFILPETRRNEVLSFIRQGLRDSAITRTNAGWGVQVPGDEGHVIYVWFDALINYIAAIGWPDGDWQNYWPADVEWMGKDILVRFHATLWPAMLMGLGLDLPKTLVGHGWVLMGDEKISKSKGNVVAPLELADDLAARVGCSRELAVDAVRYYMARTMPFENDYRFTYEDFDLKYNTDLVNDLSNGIHRVISMTHNFCGGKVPPGEISKSAHEEVAAALRSYESAMVKFRIDEAAGAASSVVKSLNMFIDTRKPWDLNRRGATEELGGVMRTLLWMVRVCEGVMRPITPTLSDKIASLLQLSPADRWDELLGDAVIAPGHELAAQDPIYQRLDKKKMQEETKTEAPSVDEITIEDFMKVKLRVARVLDAEPVQDSDKLLRLQLIVGDERRQVLAGIAQQYTPDAIIGRQVIVVTNLKPRKMRGFESQGMILAADGLDGEAILLLPDKDAPDGTPVH